MRVSLDKSFDVNQPASRVWEYLVDPYKVVECVPGVELTEKISDTVYKGDVGMKLGPVNAAFDGEVTYEKMDKEARQIRIVGKGVDKKGKGGAEMALDMTLSEEGGVTTITTTMNVSVVGVIAQFGSRLIADVSDHIFKQFVNNFQALMEGKELDEKDKSLKSGAMVGTVAKSIVKNIFGGKEKGEEKGED